MLTTIVLLGIATVAFLVLSVLMAFNMAAIKTTIDEEIQRTDERFLMQRGISKLAAGLGATRARIAALSDVGMLEGEELSFVQEIERAASAIGVTQELNVGSAGTQLSDWEQEIPVTILAAGQYPKMLRFMEALEHLRYYIIVSAIRMSTALNSTNASQPDDVGVDFTASVYVIGKKAPAFVGLPASAPPVEPPPVSPPVVSTPPL